MGEPTLPDYLRAGLDIVSIGINPSSYSVEKGFAFARPGNRFWPALNASGLVPEPFVPGREAIEKLFSNHGIGFTDVVKKPSRRADELKEDDFAKGARLLHRKLLRCQPRIAWFQGVSAYGKFLEHALGVRRRILPGLQAERIGETAVFVSPNPSGANPAANPKALLPYYRELKRLRDRVKRSAERSARRRC